MFLRDILILQVGPIRLADETLGNYRQVLTGLLYCIID